MDHKRGGEWRTIGEDIAKSQKITARWARELYKSMWRVENNLYQRKVEKKIKMEDREIMHTVVRMLLSIIIILNEHIGT